MRYRGLPVIALATLIAGCGSGGSGTTTGAGATAAATVPAAGASPAPDARLRPIDRNVLAALVQSGGNRACGHTIESELTVPDSTAGAAIAKSLPQSTYFVRVAQSASGNGALVIIDRQLVPTDDAIVKMVAKMDAIAKAHHGHFDRWETEPVKSC